MRNIGISLLCLFVVIFEARSQNDLPGKEILDWEPPKDFVKKYPYYLSGYDYDGSPVWVIEFGKWDMKSAVDAGGEYVANFDRYVQQCFRRFVESSKKIIPEDPGFFVISDLEGYDLAQAGSVSAVQKYLWVVRTFLATIKDGGKFKGNFIVNANYLFQTVWNLSKPLFGQVLEDITLFGTNTEVWKVQLLKQVPKDQLPEWYGGSKAHHPLKVYGK